MAKKIKSFKVSGDGKENRRKQAREASYIFFRIMPLLFVKGYVRTKDLEKEFGLDERKAQRVMEPFKEMGILVRDDFDQGKWNFNGDRHRWNKTVLYGNDGAMLAFLMKFAKVMGAHMSKEVRASIDKNFVLGSEDYPYFIITSRVKDPDTGLKFYQDLMDSIQDRKKVNLTYKSAGKDKTVKAWPMYFVMCDGMWYLAYLLEEAGGVAKKIRTLRYTHIANVEALIGEEFERPGWVKDALKTARNIWFNERRDIEVELEVDNCVKDYFELSEYFPLQKITASGPKTFRVQTRICNEMEAVPNILRFIPYIKVVSPASLKKAVRDRVKQYLN